MIHAERAWSSDDEETALEYAQRARARAGGAPQPQRPASVPEPITIHVRPAAFADELSCSCAQGNQTHSGHIAPNTPYMSPSSSSPCAGYQLQQRPLNATHDKLLFLDIDGVCHSIYSKCEERQFNRCCMERLKHIVDATGCSIVLSSSWRRQERTLQLVNAQLQLYGIPPIISTTRVGRSEYRRIEDITDWIQRHTVRRWVALDDYPMPGLQEHQVLVPGGSGLTDKNVEQAIEYLNS